ncbi:MAG: hypothetical protein HY881_22285 [Deltaproteobacteria bacterium]|nr:hypothetical protein [Deltaproteobacteria bacterium]
MKPIKIVVVLFLFFTVGCASLTDSEQRISRRSADSPENMLTPVDYSRFGRPPIPVKILLLIPAEFERFEHVSNYEETRIHHRLGRDAELELRDAFGIEFAKVEVRPVESQDRAMQMLWPEDPENVQLRAYDYVAIPKFLRVDSLESKEKYAFEIDLQVEFNAKNGSSITIKGHGESMIGKYAQSTPEKGAVLTLQYAVSALLDGIEKRRSLFVR